MEYFTDQQDIKTKTKNWCYKLQETGVLSSEQLAQCINTFKDTTNGLLPKEFVSPPSGLDRNYSLYNTKHQKTLTSKINNDAESSNDNNSNAIMLTSSDDIKIACNSQHIIYSVTNINDATVQQNELYFTLDKQASESDTNVYSILSPYGKFLSINSKLEVSFSGISSGASTQWNIIKINSSGSTSNDNTIMIEPLQYNNYYLIYDTELQILKVIYGISSNTEWMMTSKTANADTDDSTTPEDISMYDKYTLSNETIIYNIYDINIKKICITELVNTYTELKTQINTQYNTVIQHIKNTYAKTLNPDEQDTNDSNNQRYTDNTADIESACSNLRTIQSNLTTNIDKNFLTPLQTLLDDIIIREKSTNYNDYMVTLQSDYDKIENSINQSTLIIERQLKENNALNNTYNNNTIKDKQLQNNEQIISVNSDIVNNMSTQYKYVLKLYPLFILILIILIIYLIYRASQNFINNVF